MDPMYRQAMVRGILGTLFFMVLIFGSAGTIHYWQGWLFLAVFASLTTAFTIYLAMYDRPLLERRMKAGPGYETEPSQRIIVSLIFLLFFALMILPAVDHRFGWSPVPASVTVLGNALVIFSFYRIFRVVTANSFAASNIRVEQGQTVIDTGPYATVRHPMYAATLWLIIGMPLALGSWWWTLLIIPFIPVLAWRLLDEERILRRDLHGYVEYTERVRYRLIPYVW
jgi:protein-S-isoprenylcysteine O-methyltransferase Ste14